MAKAVTIEHNNRNIGQLLKSREAVALLVGPAARIGLRFGTVVRRLNFLPIISGSTNAPARLRA